MSYEFRPLDQDDGDAITELGLRAFGKPFSPDPRGYFKWKYQSPPAGSIIGEVAVHGKKLVGAYSVLPTRMLVAGKLVRAAISLDTMVDPDHQGKGLFVTLAGRLYEHLGRDGYKLVYGFPNDKSVHGLIKYLQWNRVGTLSSRTLISSLNSNVPPGGRHLIPLYLAGRAVAAAYRLVLRYQSRLAGNIRVRRSESADERYDQIWEDSYFKRRQICQIRDARFLQWRFFDNPMNEYVSYIATLNETEVVGYVVFSVSQGRRLKQAVLMDWNSTGAMRGMILAFVLKAFLSLQRTHDVDAMSVYLREDPKADDIFKGVPWLPRTVFEHQPVLLGARWHDESPPDLEFLKQVRHWHITPADMDWV
jgi:GNAT superfamily N-acetyltransferase